MIVKVNYRKPKRKSPIKWMVFTFCGMFLGIMAFSFSSEDDFLYLYNLNNQVLQKTKVYQLVSNQYEDWGGDEDQMPAYNTGGTTTATSGTGLNLLLINNIQTEGYVKDYLSICAANQNGELSDTYSVHAPAVMLIAATLMERGVYDGTPLPKWYLPWDDTSNSPYYNTAFGGLSASEVNLYRFDSSSYAKLSKREYSDTSTACGAFGFKSESLATVSKTSTGRTNGDARNFPDACTDEDRVLNAAISKLNVVDMAAFSKSVSEAAFGALNGLANNRGYNGATCMYFGLTHGIAANGQNYRINPDSGFNTRAMSDEEKAKAVSVPVNDFTVGLQNAKNAGADVTVTWNSTGAAGAAMAMILLLNSDDNWYITQDFVDAFTQEAGYFSFFRYTQNAWNAVHPDDQVNSGTELRKRLQPYVKDIPTAVKEATGVTISTNDAISAYGIADYNNNTYDAADEGDAGKLDWYGTTGYVFHVSNSRCAGYVHKYSDGSDPFLLQDFESSGLAYMLCTSLGGQQAYATLLKYMGVDVDPTNPDTYMNKFSGDGWSAVSSEYQDVLKANGLDTSKLTDERAKIVNVAASYLGTKYLQCRNGAGQDGALCDGFCYNNMDAKATHLDCSAFIWRCYKEAGFDCTGFPTNTSGYATNDGVLVETTVDQLKPGDVIWFSHGHVELYLGQDDSTIYYIHESTWGVGCVYGTHRKEGFPGKGCKLYRYTRFENE